jgi:hypothetical protein
VSWALAAAAFSAGKSTLIEWVSKGAAMMKITSNTSITSTMGVTLMSDMGLSGGFFGEYSAMLLPQVLVENVVRKCVDLGLMGLVVAVEKIVGKQRRQRHR